MYTLVQVRWVLFYTPFTLTSFVTRIDSFLSVSCCVCIVYDAHGVTNARYRHNSTDTHLKRDPRHPTYYLRNTLVVGVVSLVR